MERISDREIRFTEDETVVVDAHDGLLGMGHGYVAAVELITGKGEEAEREQQSILNAGPGTPTVREQLLKRLPSLDEVLTPEFLAYLRDEIW